MTNVSDFCFLLFNPIKEGCIKSTYLHSCFMNMKDPLRFQSQTLINEGSPLELLFKELNHLAAILHVYAGGSQWDIRS